jgi:hypothetical protein
VKSFTRLAAAALAASAFAATWAALPAQAQTAQTARTAATSGGLKEAQTLTTARIDGRLETLNALSLAVNNAEHLTSADRASLSSLIKSDVSGLTSLRTKVAGETTVAAVRADAVAMVDDYRIYLLVAPKVHLTNAFDIESAAAATLQKLHDKLAARVAGSPGGGTAVEKQELADLQTQIQAAQQADAGRVATLLGIQPGPDASAIRSALTPLVEAAKNARNDLVKARHDAKDLIAALK